MRGGRQKVISSYYAAFFEHQSNEDLQTIHRGNTSHVCSSGMRCVSEKDQKGMVT